MLKRFLVVFLLGFSSGLPLALLSGTLQAWFADSGCSVFVVSLMSLIGLPYSYRFLWAPLVDHYSLSLRLGRRRSWMFLMQALLLMGFNMLTWFSPRVFPGFIVAIAVLLTFFSATQDIVVDAQRAEYLQHNEKSFGIFLSTLGYRLALLLGGGGSLLCAHFWGWGVAFHATSFLMLIGLIATCISTEPDVPKRFDAWPTARFVDSFLPPFQAFFARPRLGWIVLFIVLYKLGEAFTASTSGVVMPFLIQGLGFSLHLIAYVNKILGVLAAISGGFIAGLVLMRWPLYKGLLVFGCLQIVSCFLFMALALYPSVPLFCVAVVCENIAAGLCSVALVTFFMQIVDMRYTATQLSMFVAFAALPRIFSGPIAGVIEAYIGWSGLYAVVCALAMAYIPILRMIMRPNDATPDESWLNVAAVLKQVPSPAK